jgi:hypothetical protein
MEEYAQVIAGDLVALYRDRAIRAADDPEARFYGTLMVFFEARYAGRAFSKRNAWGFSVALDRTHGARDRGLSARPL